ncbi:hypothetical protein QP568_04130 [Propionimicrobium lymphophilum]|uniref:hypothetical protein n=1 Tax=Propionimicrobium lymphophilum TaxID=33012 RepID=UPI00254A5A74|nr:hypothetical protein [Propionimicrobium lymphophilum]MDK7709500.1 hypothetical protein [Propionimicrobium lymphophilum]MDK7733486.1 hypothetical protein [Propionimicrobium lymphophilum]
MQSAKTKGKDFSVAFDKPIDSAVLRKDASLQKAPNIPRSLNFLRAISVLACFVSSMLGIWSAAGSDEFVQSFSDSASSIVDVQTVKSDVYTADALAAKSIVADENDDYLQPLQEAAVMLSQQMRDAQASVALSKQLPGAAAELGKLSASGDFQTLNQSKQSNDSGVGAEANAQVNALSDKISSLPKGSTYRFMWLLMPIAVLFYVNVRHAQLTRRVFNLGLLLATLLSAGSMYLLGASGLASARMVGTEHEQAYTRLRIDSQTLSDFAIARSTGNRAVAAASLDAGAQEISEDWSRQLEDISAGVLVTDTSFEVPFDTYKAAQSKAVEEPSAQNISASDEAADALATKLSQKSESRRSEVSAQAEDQRRANNRNRLLAVGMNAAAMLLAGWGLSQPLRKYLR